VPAALIGFFVPKTAVRGGWGLFTDRPNTKSAVTFTPTLYYGNANFGAFNAASAGRIMAFSCSLDSRLEVRS
jgi:hypothetical protein